MDLNCMKGREPIQTGRSVAGGMQQTGAGNEPTVAGNEPTGAGDEPTGARVGWVNNGVRMTIPSGVRGDGAVFIVRP